MAVHLGEEAKVFTSSPPLKPPLHDAWGAKKGLQVIVEAQCESPLPRGTATLNRAAMARSRLFQGCHAILAVNFLKSLRSADLRGHDEPGQH